MEGPQRRRHVNDLITFFFFRVRLITLETEILTGVVVPLFFMFMSGQSYLEVFSKIPVIEIDVRF